MALKSPLMPSPTSGLSSAFSPFTDSPNSPAPNGAFSSIDKRWDFVERAIGLQLNDTCRSSGPSDSLAPPPSPYPQQIEPSPVDSNGTETTDIEEDAQEDARVKSTGNGELLDIEITSPQSAASVCVQHLESEERNIDRPRTECRG